MSGRRTIPAIAAVAVTTALSAGPASAFGSKHEGLADAFAAVKDAYLVVMQGNRSQSKAGHRNWCMSVSYGACHGEMRRLAWLVTHKQEMTLADRCYIASNIKVVREKYSSGRRGSWSGHNGWCKSNPGRANAFLSEEVSWLYNTFD